VVIRLRAAARLGDPLRSIEPDSDTVFGSARVAAHLRTPWRAGQHRGSDALAGGREFKSGHRIDLMLRHVKLT